MPNVLKVPIDSNIYNTYPIDMILNQSGYDLFLVVLTLIVNVPFCHEDGAGELCKLEILIAVS